VTPNNRPSLDIFIFHEKKQIPDVGDTANQMNETDNQSINSWST